MNINNKDDIMEPNSETDNNEVSLIDFILLSDRQTSLKEMINVIFSRFLSVRVFLIFLGFGVLKAVIHLLSPKGISILDFFGNVFGFFIGYLIFLPLLFLLWALISKNFSVNIIRKHFNGIERRIFIGWPLTFLIYGLIAGILGYYSDRLFYQSLFVTIAFFVFGFIIAILFYYRSISSRTFKSFFITVTSILILIGCEVGMGFLFLQDSFRIENSAKININNEDLDTLCSSIIGEVFYNGSYNKSLAQLALIKKLVKEETKFQRLWSEYLYCYLLDCRVSVLKGVKTMGERRNDLESEMLQNKYISLNTLDTLTAIQNKLTYSKSIVVEGKEYRNMEYINDILDNQFYFNKDSLATLKYFKGIKEK